MFALPTTCRLRQRLYFINISIKAIQRSVGKNLSVQTKTAPLHVGQPVTLQISSPLGKMPEKLFAAEKFTE
jgi:hypothetical protein